MVESSVEVRVVVVPLVGEDALTHAHAEALAEAAARRRPSPRRSRPVAPPAPHARARARANALARRAAHVLARSLVAEAESIPVDELRLAHARSGAPRFFRGRRLVSTRASITHASGALAVAISRRRLGLDLESIERAGEVLEAAPLCFSPEERRALAAASSSRVRAERALASWTLKEAYVKALALSPGAPLTSFGARWSEAAATIAPTTISAQRPVDRDPSRWRFRLYACLGDHRLALVHDGPCVVRLETRDVASLLPVGPRHTA